MADPPTFFFSHARQDRETPGKYLRSFFDDLEIKLAQWSAVSLAEQRLGTFDARVPQGENWDANLSRGLSNDSCLVAILTPLYFNRPNCGKELAVFLFRCPGLSIDTNGALTGVRNIMLIRWLPENAYAANTGKDTLIPPILRLIEDTPADDGQDEERTKAIERYRKKGMEKCVKVEPHYGELLDLFVARIRGLAELPPAVNVSFATAEDAFKYDWVNHFNSAGAAIVPQPASASTAALVAPRPLASVVVFYITRRTFTPDRNGVYFADQLIAEPLPGVPAATDPALAALLADVREAGVAEGFTVFHAAADPVVPANAETLIARLASLSESFVMTALVIDPNVWPGASASASGADAVGQIVRSSMWTGAVLLPSLDAESIDVGKLVKTLDLPPRLVALPRSSEDRLVMLRQSFVDTRGRLLRTTCADSATAMESLPLLRGVGAEGA
jgi:hypothetical protein